MSYMEKKSHKYSTFKTFTTFSSHSSQCTHYELTIDLNNLEKQMK